MVCSSGIGFDPTYEGRELTFGFHGIWQGTALLYDRQTRSLWLHITGKCIRGRLKGTELKPIVGRHVLWREWKRDHPDTDVMLELPKHRANYMKRYDAHRGLDYFPPRFRDTIQVRDDRLELSALCYGVIADGRAKAYPFKELAQASGGVVNDLLGKTPLAVIYDSQTRSATAFRRNLKDHVVVLERASPERLRDRESGAVFDPAGRCIQGKFQGQQLEPVRGLQAEWYGWYSAHPLTELFVARAGSGKAASGTQQSQGVEDHQK